MREGAQGSVHLPREHAPRLGGAPSREDFSGLRGGSGTSRGPVRPGQGSYANGPPWGSDKTRRVASTKLLSVGVRRRQSRGYARLSGHSAGSGAGDRRFRFMPAQMDRSPGATLPSGVTELGPGPSGGQERIG